MAGLLAATIGRLCEGQVLELQHTYDVDRTEEAYLALHRRQDRRAARHGLPHRRHRRPACPAPQIDALTDFGHSYGMAFQIVDDILDVVATDEQLGKPAGHDLVEGVYTLPVLRVLAAGRRRRRPARSSCSAGRSRAPSWTRPARSCAAAAEVDAALATARDLRRPGRRRARPTWPTPRPAPPSSRASDHLLESVRVAAGH